MKIRDQREKKVKSGEAWMDIDFKRALIPQLLTSYLSSPSSLSVFTAIQGLSSSITEKQYTSGSGNKGYENNQKVFSKEKLVCLKIPGQIPLLISAVKFY